MKNLKDKLLNEHIQYAPQNIMNKNKCYDYWEQAYEILDGQQKFEDCKMLQEIFNYLDDDTCTWIVENLDTDYNLGLFE